MHEGEGGLSKIPLKGGGAEKRGGETKIFKREDGGGKLGQGAVLTNYGLLVS